MPLQVQLVSPESIVFTGEATMVVARTPDGDIAFQAGHIPFIGTIVGRGPVKIFLTDGGVKHVAVHSGFVQVAGSTVSILSDVAELPEAIDVTRATAARDRARATLASDPGNAAARAAADRAELRLTVAASATSSRH
jgi:F-type H+-transporting ATPase subunit epsilon